MDVLRQKIERDANTAAKKKAKQLARKASRRFEEVVWPALLKLQVSTRAQQHIAMALTSEFEARQAALGDPPALPPAALPATSSPLRTFSSQSLFSPIRSGNGNGNGSGSGSRPLAPSSAPTNGAAGTAGSPSTAVAVASGGGSDGASVDPREVIELKVRVIGWLSVRVRESRGCVRCRSASFPCTWSHQTAARQTCCV